MLRRRSLLLVLLALVLLASLTVQAARRTLEVWIMQTGNPAGAEQMFDELNKEFTRARSLGMCFRAGKPLKPARRQ